jgi:hypothetical protein
MPHTAVQIEASAPALGIVMVVSPAKPHGHYRRGYAGSIKPTARPDRYGLRT